MKTVTEIFATAADRLNDMGHKSTHLPHYSGRGMYGSTINAISSDASGALVGAMLFDIARNEEEMGWAQAMSIIPVRSDQMGLSEVYY